ncbi:MAG: hypothetical protein KGI52_11265, partial [Burkholderiales bacterium]|nr:hypothetical protein [Burkholderiales bacterium]
MKSLQRQLVVWLVCLFMVVGLFAAGISFYSAQRQANELLDHQLRQIALSVDDGDRLSEMGARLSSESPTEREQDFVIQTWVKNSVARTSRPGFYLPSANKTGFSDIVTPSGRWRVYSILYPDRTVQVSLADEVRFQI